MSGRLGRLRTVLGFTLCLLAMAVPVVLMLAGGGVLLLIVGAGAGLARVLDGAR